MTLQLHQFNMEDCCRALLKRCGLPEYIDTFLKNGYDDVSIIRQIDEDDLKIMGFTCITETCYILDTIKQLNQMFMEYMSVDEAYVRPSSEHVLNCVMEKYERDGVLPSGEDIFSVVLEKLESEGIILCSHNNTMYIKDGYRSTRREYNMLRARFAQELFLPNQSVAEALQLIHESSSHGQLQAPPKPPKPKDIPVYNPKTGRMVWYNNHDNQSNYENVNQLYEFITTKLDHPPTLPLRNSLSNSPHIASNSPHIASNSPQQPIIQPPLRHAPLQNNIPKGDVKYEICAQLSGSVQSNNSSPVPVRTVKKKQTFFKRVKHNLFGKSNSSLDSYLASSTKTLISDRSSECSNSKLSFFNKKQSKKDKGRYERQLQRNHSAPVSTVRNANLHQIPEQQNNTTCQNPTYAQPYQYHQASPHPGVLRFGPRDQTFTSITSPATPDHMICEHRPLPPLGPTKSDTFSNTSISSGSVSGDSAYSSKPCLSAIKSSHRPVIYGPIPFGGAPGHFAQFGVPPLPVANFRRSSAEQRRRCPCRSCRSDRIH